MRRSIGASAMAITSTAAAAPPVQHPVKCPYCTSEFDLFAASWCEHPGARASKVCPRCTRCLCGHSAYGEPRFWTEAPPVFQKQGFHRLFLFYL